MLNSNEARRVAVNFIKGFEYCARKRSDGKYEAYCDPYSPMGKALQRRGLWQRYIDGKVEIPLDIKNLSGAPWTIGWGQTGKHVFSGVVWTQEQCDLALNEEVTLVEIAIRTHLLKREPTTNQHAALVSFAYNVGTDIDDDNKAEGLGDSTLLRKFNAGDIAGAADGFLSWVFAGGVKSNGLARRRAAERALFLEK